MTATSLLSPATPLPPLARVAFRLAHAVLGWELRRTTRRHLARLDPHLLDDVGLDAHTAQEETARPFWR
ncbi:DUF1127 domain-containing protein [Falsirhodobacter sp. 20TX0035]|uniref:DUF1127 domain-containing protein n=1 Tax=Falsirhodobacter sp. 20TX0035 TaxID=3022019 RepID=UPI00232DA416|nr:DUF1127 domain-containing protein [Falsirhodobacter sp. 20TX0035]MDB6453103.1 DUF1127 domain-containing protein [Falsirhodobacter sp. 20TX0035]